MLGSASTASGIKLSSRLLERYLLRGEEVVVATRHHWAKLVEPVFTVLVGFLAIAWLGGVLERSTGEPALWLWWMWFALVARLGWMLLEWRNEWFVATDKRLLKTYGLITHRVAMMPLRKVTDMNYGRSALGRVLGYGTFLMESAGQDQALREVRWVPDPDNTYRAICDIIFGPGDQDELGLMDEDDVHASAPSQPRGRSSSGWDGAGDVDDGQDDPAWEVSHDDQDITGPLPRLPRR